MKLKQHVFLKAFICISLILSSSSYVYASENALQLSNTINIDTTDLRAVGKDLTTGETMEKEYYPQLKKFSK